MVPGEIRKNFESSMIAKVFLLCHRVPDTGSRGSDINNRKHTSHNAAGLALIVIMSQRAECGGWAGGLPHCR